MAGAQEDIPDVSGGCLCGAVRHVVAPRAAQVLCFCDRCRRATGAPAPGFVSGAVARMTGTAAAPWVCRASAVATRGFCAGRGNAPVSRSTRSATIALFAGTAETASHGEARPDWRFAAAALQDPGVLPGPREVS